MVVLNIENQDCFLPYRQSKNWYYDNGKPSHTWGGANNFISIGNPELV